MVRIQLPVESAGAKTAVLMAMITAGALMLLGVSRLTTSATAGHARTAQAEQAVAVQGPGLVDIGFAQDMSLHHEQALLMARLALAKGSPRVQQLAQGIVAQQLKEIGYLQGWLMLWHAPGVAPADDMRWMRDAYARSARRDPSYEQYIASCVPGQGMPGMASPQELDVLAEAASAAAFDTTFLALMVRHHQGAVVMATFASEHAALDPVRDLARAMAAEQQQELARMLSWLGAAKAG